MRTILLALGLLFAAQAASAADVYLFDLLKQPRYRTSFDKMMANDTAAPDWLKLYRKRMDGPSQPSKRANIDGQSVTLADACKANDCGENAIQIAFGENSEVIAARITEDGRVMWWGAPSASLRSALENASR